MNPIVMIFSLVISWVMLSEDASFPNLAFGFFIGISLVLLFPSLLDAKNFSKKVRNFFRFSLLFSKEFIYANFTVAKLILFYPLSKIHSAYLEIPTTPLSFNEVLFMSHIITLTPGTVTVFINKEGTLLTLHAMYVGDIQKVIEEVESVLKRPIMGFTR